MEIGNKMLCVNFIKLNFEKWQNKKHKNMNKNLNENNKWGKKSCEIKFNENWYHLG